MVLYQIEGATQTAYTNTFVSGTTTDGKINFVGYYTSQRMKAPIGSYIMGEGHMFYLDAGSPIYGTTWVLTDATGKRQSNSQSASMV